MSIIKIGKVMGDVLEAGAVKNVTNNYYGDDNKPEEGKDLVVEAKPKTRDEVIGDAIRYVMDLKDEKNHYLFKLKNQWYAIYRILADRKIVRVNDFAGFSAYIDGLKLGELRKPLTARELSKCNAGILSDKFKDWDIAKASSSEQFVKMKHIADPFNEFLGKHLPE